MSVLIDLNHGWLFQQKRASRSWMRGGDSSACWNVDLPHCWNAHDTFQDKVEYYRGHGAYRKTFTMEPDAFATDSQGVWVLETEGFYGTGEVWLNGRKVAEIDGEYLGFSLDVSGYLAQGENLLAIRLTNRCRSFVLPGIAMPDFLLHGGLAGRMFLRLQPHVHIERSGLQVTCTGITEPHPSVHLSATISNSSSEAYCAVARMIILDPSGRQTGRVETPAIEVPLHGKCSSGDMVFKVLEPTLWSPDEPSLYLAKCEILVGGIVVDRCEKKFGLRSAVFEPGRGFFLNGKRTELRGCNRHENMPGFGSALPLAIHRDDVRLLRETGCNIVRLSHYPQHPAFLDACDQLGMMVYPEIASWKSVRTGRWLRRALRQMERMVLRDRHRPCVILWGMGNESRSRKAYRALGSLIGSIDHSRAVTYAENHYHRAVREHTADIPDVWGCNYEFETLEKGCSGCRLKTTLVSECSNMPTAMRGNMAEELKQVQVIERDLAFLDGKTFNSGCIIWCMNDYATLRKRRFLRYSGIFDAWRIPKMSRSFLQARWLDTPFVRIFGDWSARADGLDVRRAREIHVFTNCRQIVLVRNGIAVQTQEDKSHMTFSVDFEPGTLEAKGRCSGHDVVDRLLSFGAAESISVKTERLQSCSSEEDVIVVEIGILDGAGVLCTN
ncbi:MAG: glycoside hydrolase family 2 TIM barrel-domain containing protein, partial [bacterium]